MIQLAAWTMKLLRFKALVEAAKSAWKAIRPKRWPKAAAPPAAPSRPRRRVWRGGPPSAAALLLALGAAAGCAGPLSGMSKTEILAFCEAVAPCGPAEECPDTIDGIDPPPAPVPEPPAPGPPPPGEGGAPPATPPPGPAPGDFDFGSVTWLHASPAAFRVTATLADVQVDGLEVSWAWSHPPWPQWRGAAGEPWVIGNMWILAEAKGAGRGWYGATWEWLREDTDHVTLDPGSKTAPPFKQSKRPPIDTWRPRSGEWVGFMATTITRAGIRPENSPRERSPVVWVRWP